MIFVRTTFHVSRNRVTLGQILFWYLLKLEILISNTKLMTFLNINIVHFNKHFVWYTIFKSNSIYRDPENITDIPNYCYFNSIRNPHSHQYLNDATGTSIYHHLYQTIHILTVPRTCTTNNISIFMVRVDNVIIIRTSSRMCTRLFALTCFSFDWCPVSISPR